MKRLIIFFTSLFILLCLNGCKLIQEKINIEFIINSESHYIEISKGTSINKDMVPINNKDEIVDLYFDNVYNKVYDNRTLCENNKIYVKTTKDEQLYLEVCKTYWEQFIKPNRDTSTIEDVWVYEYLGTYNNCFVAVLLDRKNCAFYDIIGRFTIADLEFTYSYGHHIMVYSDGAFLFLFEAYGQNLITYEDLKQIHYNHYH